MLAKPQVLGKYCRISRLVCAFAPGSVDADGWVKFLIGGHAHQLAFNDASVVQAVSIPKLSEAQELLKEKLFPLLGLKVAPRLTLDTSLPEASWSLPRPNSIDVLDAKGVSMLISALLLQSPSCISMLPNTSVCTTTKETVSLDR